MAAALDPLSQLIGAQSAQIAEVNRGLTDLRAEVITNRSQNQTWREDFLHAIDGLQVELRTVKHDARNQEQAHALLGDRLNKIDTQLTTIEDIIKVWRVRLTMFMSLVIAASTVVGVVLAPLIEHWVSKLY